MRILGGRWILIFWHELSFTVRGRQNGVGEVMGWVEERIAFEVGKFRIIDGIEQRCPFVRFQVLLQTLWGADGWKVWEKSV